MTLTASPPTRIETPEHVGVLLINLGTPDAPTPAALRRYLGQFLWDRRIVDIPRPLWWLILHGIILRIRPRRSARAYATVWTERGSPLRFHTQDQAAALTQALSAEHGDRVHLAFAMRYGNPSIADAVQRLADRGISRLLVVPLYPQYSGTTTASAFDALAAAFTTHRYMPEVRFINHYCDFAPYITALASRIQAYWQTNGRPERLVLSYHGIPERHVHEGDPYFDHCQTTSRLLADKLGIEQGFCLTTFQSRFGREKWLQPYTDVTLKALPALGVRRIQVFCPGFAADCLETLEEIAIENRHYFLESGGSEFGYIPALNSDPAHIDALRLLISRQLDDWLEEAVQ